MKNIKVKIYQRKHFGNIIERYVNTDRFVKMLIGSCSLTKEDFDVCYECVSEIEMNYKLRRELTEVEYPNVLLECVFKYFNVDEAAQDRGRINYSLSVLDVLEVDGEKYQVMGIGFEKLNF